MAMELKKQVAKCKKPYLFFQARLYPSLPYLIYKAAQVRSQYPTPPAVSNELTLGKSNKKILILGESTAAGVGAAETKNTLAQQLHLLLEQQYEITNLGKNGIRAKELLPCFRKKIPAYAEPLAGIFLYIGANDCFKLTQPESYREALEKVIAELELLLQPDWIYLADIPPVHLFPAFPPVLRSFLREQRDFLQCQMQALAHSNPKLVFEPIRLDLNPAFFCEDRIHPSPLGYAEIAKFSHAGLRRFGKI